MPGLLYLLPKNFILRERPRGFAGVYPPFRSLQPTLGPYRGSIRDGVAGASLLPRGEWGSLPVAVFIGASRLLLGVHFLTDLVAGAVLAASCATVVLWW